MVTSDDLVCWRRADAQEPCPGGGIKWLTRSDHPVDRAVKRVIMVSSSSGPGGPDFALGVPADVIPAGNSLAGHVSGEAVLLSRIDEKFYAVSGTCTHYGAPLSEGFVDGETVRCPWHHACFSLKTGAALKAPAFDALQPWVVEAADDRIFVRTKMEASTLRHPAIASRVRNVVIVGGGAAGFAAAEMLRRQGFKGQVTMLSDDYEPPCDRPNLSKDYLARTAPADWIPLKPRDFYEENRIDLHLNVHVDRVDSEQKRVITQEGFAYPFDALLIATGAEPIRLNTKGFDRPNVHTLRSVDDADRIIANCATAKCAAIRLIFERYLAVCSLGALAGDLADQGIRTKVRTYSTGRTVGGMHFTRGSLSQLLKNPLFIGKVAHGGSLYEGEHDAIVSDELWQLVQNTLAANTYERRLGSKVRYPSLLTGLLTDADGRPMTPVFSSRGAVRHHYYVTRLKSDEESNNAWRVPAGEIDRAVLGCVVRWFRESRSRLVGTEEATSVRNETTAAAELANALPDMNLPEQRRVMLEQQVRVQLGHDCLLVVFGPGEEGHEVQLPTRLGRKGVELKLVLTDDGSDPTRRSDPVLLKLVALSALAQRTQLNGGSDPLVSRYSKRHLWQLLRAGGRQVFAHGRGERTDRRRSAPAPGRCTVVGGASVGGAWVP